MKIRQADKNDIDELVGLNREVQELHVELFPHLFLEPDSEPVAAMFRDMLDDDLITIFVAEEEGRELIGYITVRKQIRPAHALIGERQCGYIDHVCVAEKHRGKGIFKQLMAEVESLVRFWGMTRIELDVWTENELGKRVFSKYGFKTYKEKMAVELD